MSKHDMFYAAVHIVIRDPQTNYVLFQRRQGTDLYCGWLGLPAGHVDAGEHPLEAAIRETKEELGITVFPEDIALECHSTRRYPDGRVYFDAYYDFGGDYKDEIGIQEPDKCSELVWLPPWNLPPDVIGYEKEALNELFAGIPFFSQDVEKCEDEIPPSL